MKVRASGGMAVAVLLVLLALGLAGCGQQERASAEGTGAERAGQASGSAAGSGANRDSGAPAARPYEPLGRVVVTRDDQRLAPGCRPRQAAGLMTHFLDAYNRGDRERLSSFFPARADLLSWLYSMQRGREVEVSVDNREDLLRYFAERHERHDRMRLLSIEVGPNGFISDGEHLSSEHQARPGADTRPLGGIGFLLARRADDLEPGPEGAERPVIGKGVIDCRRQQLLLMTIGTPMTKPDDTFGATRMCRKLDGPNRGGAILACTAD